MPIVDANNNTFAVWITGLPSSGKSTLASELARQVRAFGIELAVLESDPLRKLFSQQPAYNDQEREYFYRSLAFIGATLVQHRISVLFDATANRRAYRDRARELIPRFVEVFVDCPLEICMQRDSKGIYRLAREAKAEFVPGVQAVYEPPQNPEVVVHGDREEPAAAAHRVIQVLIARGFLTRHTGLNSPQDAARPLPASANSCSALATTNAVLIATSGFSEIELIPCSTSHAANSG